MAKVLKRNSKVLDKIKAYRDKMNTGSGFYLKDGDEKIIRVLPVVGLEEGLFYVEAIRHRINNGNHWCPQGMTGEACPVCELVDELKASGDEEDKKLAKDLSQKKKWLIWIIDREDGKPTPRLFFAPKAVINVLTRDYMDDEYDDILDISEGRDYKVSRNGKGLNTEYDASPRPKTSPMLPDADEEEMEAFLKGIKSWDEIIKVKSYEELQALIDGEDLDGNASDDKSDDKDKDDDSDNDPDTDDDNCDNEEDAKEDKGSKKTSTSDIRSRIKSRLGKKK